MHACSLCADISSTGFCITLLGEGTDRSALAPHTGAKEEAPIKDGALALLCSLSLDTNHEHTQAEQAQSRCKSP